MLRLALAGDLPAIERLIHDAYWTYVERIGKSPAPMLEDYAAIIAAGRATVLEQDGEIRGVTVTIKAPDHLQLDNVAVDPRHRGRGHGRALIEFAEDQARRAGLGEVRLYTNVQMTENIALYRHLGFEETGRAVEDGYARVFMRKRV